MSHKIFLLIVITMLFSCQEEISNKQYYSIRVHNESLKELKNVTLYRKGNPNIKSRFGVLPPKILKVHGFQYTPPAKEIIASWNDLEGNIYERLIDLTGIFPTQFDGGKLFIAIQPDFSVDYTFVLNKTVYSPTNRTAK
jgi:hypothetical protein